MEFYSNNDNRHYTADPCSVSIDGLDLSCVDDDSFPFILTTHGLKFGSYTQQHDGMYKKIRPMDRIIEGRFWVNSGVLTVWDLPFGANSSSIIDQVQDIAKEISSRLRYAKSKMSFILSTSVPETERHARESFVAVIPFFELDKVRSCGDLSEFLWNEMERQRRLASRTDTSTGTRDFWRHYEVVGEAIKLGVGDLKYIVENIIREYHQGQQLMLPFDGNDEPYNYMQFIEWLEEVGTYGKLPDCTGELDKVFNNEEELYLIGVNDFYFGLGDEFDYEGYSMFLEDLEQEYTGQAPIFADGRSASDMDVDSVEATEQFLTPEGLEVWKRAIIERGRVIADNWRRRITVNEQGLVYCERMIALDKLFGRHHEPEKYGNKDYYETLSSNYEGIGLYWSWMKGGGCVYYENGCMTDVLVKAWVSPHDVDWSTSTSLECMDEQELRLNPNATVQIDAIEVDVYDEKGYATRRNLPLKGSLLIGM